MRNLFFALMSVASIAWTSNALADSYSITCESNANQWRSCWVGEPIKEVILQLEYSPYVCNEGFSYGHEELFMWVDRSCRGWFEVITESGKTFNVNN